MPAGKGLLRRALIISGLALLLCGALLAALPSLLKPALNRWLPGVLADDGSARIHIRQLSWTRFELDELNLPLADGTLIQLQDLQLRFSPAGLLHGRIQDLTLARVLVSMPAPSAEKVAVAAAANAADAARSGFNQPVDIPAFVQWLSLPADSVTVQQLVFQHPAFAADLAAELTPQQWRLHGSVQLDNQPLPWQAEVQLQQNGDWLMLLAEQQTLLMQLYGHARQDDQQTHIYLDQRADLAALSERLPQLADLPMPLQELLIKAELTLPNHGVLPRDAVIGAVATLNTRPQALPAGLQWQSGSWVLSVTKTSAQDDWQFRADGQPQQVQADAQLAGLPLSIRSQQQLSGHCNAALEQCEGEGQLLNRFSSRAQTLAQFDLQPALNWQLDSAISLVLPFSLSSEAALATALQIPLTHSSLQGELIALADPSGDWQLSSIPGFTGQFSLQAADGWQLPPLNLQLLPQFYVHGNLNATRADEQLSMEPLLLELAPVQLTRPGQKHQKGSRISLNSSRISCLPERHRNGLNARCDLDLNLARSELDGWPVPDAQISGPLSLTMNQQSGEQQLSADLDLSAAMHNARVRMHLQQDLVTSKGSLQWHLTDLPLNWSSLNLDEMAGLTKLELLGGGVSGQGWVDWQPGANGWQITPDLMLRADNVSAVYDSSIALDGWSSMLALRRPFNGDYLLDAQISGKSLNPGIELKDILARSQTRIPADFSYALAEIQEVHTDVLGGRIHMPLIRFDTRKDINAFGIELQHIQLAQIAALEEKAEVQASGTLDGVLPIVLTREGAQIPGGTLFARDPGGVIRYKNSTSEALGQSDQTVGLAMQLLENFQYEQLQSNIQYQPDGQLNLGLQFQGKNPDFFGGQKTHLNVNLEYNLLDLLESLRVTQDVVSKLESKYQ